MKTTTMLMLGLLGAGALGASESDAERRTRAELGRLEEAVLVAYGRSGQLPEAGVLVRMRTLEHDLGAFAVLSGSRATFEALPPVRDRRAVPAAMMARRLNRVGVDVWRDELPGKLHTMPWGNPNNAKKK